MDDIFSYIKSQESQYRLPIQLNDSWDWSMKEHIKLTELYTNSQSLNKTEFTPIKNITRPILNLQHRTEDIEMKDVQIYVDDPSDYHLSFLVKKYHDDVFVKENDLDTFFDELNVSRIDFGAGLSKMLDKPRPEVVPLQSIIFCDQTDILSGPIGIKHYYSPDQLLEMRSKGWGNKDKGATHTVEEVIELSRAEKRNDTDNGVLTKTPGRYIEVYEVHGNLPKRYTDPEDTSGEYETRMFVVCFYQTQDSEDKGVILYTAPEKKSPFKLIKRDPVYGRALGFGGAEELFEPQVWVNYDMVRMQDMLDAASKTILKTTDPAVAQRNSLKDMDNLEIVELSPSADLGQVDTFPRNLALFERSVAEWETHAQQMGAANDAIMGQSPASGTPFKLQELVTAESHGLHEYRRGQYAKHLEEIYNEWIIPHIQRQITKGARFLSDLSLDELTYVTDAVVTNMANQRLKEMVLGGKFPKPEEIELMKQVIREDFKKKGTKHFIEIIKDEFADKPLAVKVAVAGKSKNLSLMVDKLGNVFRTLAANPALMQMPPMANIFNQIIEASGLDPVDFSGMTQGMTPMAPMEQPAQPAQPAPMAPMAA